MQNEKSNEVCERIEAEAKVNQLQEEIEKLNQHLQSNSELQDLQREDINKERIKNSEKHMRIKELEETLRREQDALEKAKSRFEELERRMK